MPQRLDRLHARGFECRLQTTQHGDQDDDAGYDQDIDRSDRRLQKEPFLPAEIKGDTVEV